MIGLSSAPVKHILTNRARPSWSSRNYSQQEHEVRSSPPISARGEMHLRLMSLRIYSFIYLLIYASIVYVCQYVHGVELVQFNSLPYLHIICRTNRFQLNRALIKNKYTYSTHQQFRIHSRMHSGCRCSCTLTTTTKWSGSFTACRRHSPSINSLVMFQPLLLPRA